MIDASSLPQGLFVWVGVCPQIHGQNNVRVAGGRNSKEAGMRPRAYPSGWNHAHYNNPEASIEPPDAVGCEYLAHHMSSPLQWQCILISATSWFVLLGMMSRCVQQFDHADAITHCEGLSVKGLQGSWGILTLKPGGAPSIAIWRVLMTLKGYRQVVSPCVRKN